MGLISAERRAWIIGRIDALLTLLFVAAGYALTELVSWAVTALPMIDSMDWGKYNWAKAPVAVFLGGMLKGYDRKKHEDPSKTNGLLNLPKSLTEGK